jgi:hypothetical protein
MYMCRKSKGEACVKGLESHTRKLSFTLLSRYAFADGHAEKKGGSD